MITRASPANHETWSQFFFLQFSQSFISILFWEKDQFILLKNKYLKTSLAPTEFIALLKYVSVQVHAPSAVKKKKKNFFYNKLEKRHPHTGQYTFMHSIIQNHTYSTMYRYSSTSTHTCLYISTLFSIPKDTTCTFRLANLTKHTHTHTQQQQQQQKYNTTHTHSLSLYLICPPSLTQLPHWTGQLDG